MSIRTKGGQVIGITALLVAIILLSVLQGVEKQRNYKRKKEINIKEKEKRK